MFEYRRKINIATLFLAVTLLLCQINISVVDTSCRYVSDELSDGGGAQHRSIPTITDNAFDRFGSAELISSRSHGSLFSIRTQARGKEYQRSLVRTLLLFVLALCFLKAAFSYLRSGLLLPEDAVASSIILFFIHSKDGKK